MTSEGLPAAPYPADVRAKGWRFELDHERIEQSDTWVLAPADLRPWLLMLWMTAWRQTPCGSLPANDALIAARIGMSTKVFEKHRAILRRGWWQASDGRLYHDFIVGMVETMVTLKTKERNRKADWRSRKEHERSALSRGTDAGQTGDGRVSDDTGTGTGTRDKVISARNELRERERAPGRTPKASESGMAGEACEAMRAAGVADVNPNNPKLVALLGKGVGVGVLAEAAARAAAKGKRFGYALGIVEGELREAEAIAGLPAIGVGAWDANRATIEAKAAELGLGPWNENDLSIGRETFAAYTERVRRAMECTGAAA